MAIESLSSENNMATTHVYVGSYIVTEMINDSEQDYVPQLLLCRQVLSYVANPFLFWQFPRLLSG